MAQQEIFQQSLNQLRNSNGIGNQAAKQLEEISKLLDQNRRDIINNNINSQSLFRQEQILTRLLEAENAKKERDLDEKRESKEALNYLISNPEYIFNTESDSLIFDDIIINNNINFNYFFRHKYQEYIKNLE